MQTTNPTGLTNPYGEPPWAAPHPQSPAHFCKESNAFVSHPHSHNITFAKSPMLWRRGTSNPLCCRQLVRKSANGLCGTMQELFSSMRNARSPHTSIFPVSIPRSRQYRNTILYYGIAILYSTIRCCTSGDRFGGSGSRKRWQANFLTTTESSSYDYGVEFPYNGVDFLYY